MEVGMFRNIICHFIPCIPLFVTRVPQNSPGVFIHLVSPNREPSVFVNNTRG